MQFLRSSRLRPALGSIVSATFVVAALTAFAAAATTPARAEATILVDAESGKVLQAENATYPWYPASLSKLMTLYVTLSAIRDHRITFDTLCTVSHNAAMQAPTKMGYAVGTQVTVDNAIKMMMVKSANDMAVMLSECVDGSIDNFAQEMTDKAHALGMSESSFVNPNGLPADGQIVSARDLAILARALIHEFPQYSFYWHIPAIQYGKRVVRNYNPLIGRFPGADGMKTGFICAAGFNLVATATRDNKQLIAVVLGAPSGAARAVKAAEMLENGFKQNPLSWLIPSLGTVDQLKPIDASPPNLKDEMCGPHRKRIQQADDDEEAAAAAGTGEDAENNNNTVSTGDASPQFSVLLSALRAPTARNANLLSDVGPVVPIIVYTGPTRPPGWKPPPEPVHKRVAAAKKPASPKSKQEPQAATTVKPKTAE
jgi:D-alanyl-D-alanine carboxypeptidase